MNNLINNKVASSTETLVNSREGNATDHLTKKQNWLNKKIKDLALDLQIKILQISNLNKWTKDKDYNFYLQLAGLLEQAQQILSDKYYKKSEETWPEKGLLSLWREKNGLSELDIKQVQENTQEELN